MHRYSQTSRDKLGRLPVFLTIEPLIQEAYQIAQDHALSGVMARGSGIPYDLRKIYNYENYNEFLFKVPMELMVTVMTIFNSHD